MSKTWLTLALTAAAAAQKIDDFSFEVEKLGGGKLRAQDFAENVLIVDLWGTWCPPCREAVPHLQRLYAKYKHHGLEVVGLNYERGAQREQADTVRKFAVKNGITYHLALGTPAVQRQVPDFRGYPTLLFFKKGLQFDHLAVGFADGHEVEIERWVATELGLPFEAVAAKHGAKAPGPGADDEAGDEDAPPAAEEDVDIPAGAIYKPGQGDTGFDFETVDVDGQVLRFAELRGKPVVLALTTTWDSEAANTAKLVQRVAKELGEGAHVVAASFERSKDPAVKTVAIKEFMKKAGVQYRAFPASIDLQKKIYLFTGFPLFLVFDAQGKLVLREGSAGEEELFTAIIGAAK